MIILDEGAYWQLQVLEEWLPASIQNASPEVRAKTCQEILACFHDIARQQGSRAHWLPHSGLLVTDCLREQERLFLYYAWRRQAVRMVVGARGG